MLMVTLVTVRDSGPSNHSLRRKTKLTDRIDRSNHLPIFAGVCLHTVCMKALVSYSNLCMHCYIHTIGTPEIEVICIHIEYSFFPMYDRNLGYMLSTNLLSYKRLRYTVAKGWLLMSRIWSGSLGMSVGR
jgi:hypothetical protein